MNIRVLREREVICSSVIGFVNTLYRLDIKAIRLCGDLQVYWERECDATEEDVYKTDGAIRASKQTR